MSHGPVNPFEPLEPPRGGLAGLRARIEADTARRARSRRRWAMAVATGVPVVVVVAILAVGLQPREPLPESFRLARIAFGLEGVPDEPLTAGDRSVVAVSRVPTRSNRVVFYFVDSMKPAPEVEVRDANRRATVNPGE